MNYHLFFFSIFWLYLNNIPLFAQSPHVSARLVDTERKVLPKAHAPLYALEDTISYSVDTARIHSEVIRIQTDEHQLDEVVVTEKYPTRNITRWLRTFSGLHGSESSPRKGELSVYKNETDENLEKHEGLWQWKSANEDS
ncbi:hypothetical protein [Bacteroides salyersiae]|jgi:hypothetical protein|uniref:hypothetical protein n=1 Tax=Bacteroides salyersiae TaxID=291644 RepID=UPI001CCB0840|nr:hypothetical protein [Bacteroides salyersiae]UBD17759.1 hypothetical protein K6V19_07665 [Bacteroides salyersiae]